MSETALRKSPVTTDESNTKRSLRWPRLFAIFLWNSGLFFLGTLVAEFSWDVWKFGFGGISVFLVLTWFGRALVFGLFCGGFIAFSTWLVQELFGSKKDSAQLPGA